jgi:tRNA (cmo5U34)-methyltransferase
LQQINPVTPRKDLEHPLNKIFGTCMHKPDNTTAHCSDTYDRQVRTTIPRYDDMHTEILNFVKVVHPHPERWLDTGCGTGTFIKNAQEQFPDTEFFIADPSEGMLVQAAQTLNGCRYSLIGRCGTTDLPDITRGRFDVITALQCHHYLSREGRHNAVRACHSLLEDDGIFITSENIRPFSGEGITRALECWGAFQRCAGRNEGEVRDHLARFDHEYFPITVTEHMKCFHDAGFPVAEILWLSYMQGVFWCRK